MNPVDFLEKAVAHAKLSGHIWPEFAACEAALESGWGESEICKQGNNLFGQKQGATTAGLAVMSVPTEEYIKGQWVKVPALWVKFADWSESFKYRMALLRALSPLYKDYAMALSAPSGTGFVLSVSKKWSTDPNRADKVLMIYDRHIGMQGKVH